MDNLLKEKDKQKHFIIGLILGISVILFTLIFKNLGLPINMILSSLIFIGKELYDERKTNPTGFDKRDLLADYLGWIIGFIISLPLLTLIN